MSDTLEERLNRHSDSFQGLLSLIPAKYYYDEETQSQWNRKKSSKADRREAKKAKLDPSNGSSAADEAKRRAEAALEESDSDVSVIYDDNGNEIRLRPESESEEEPESAAQTPAPKPVDAKKPKEEPKKDSKKEPKKDLKKDAKQVPKKDAKKDSKQAPKQDSKDASKKQQKPQNSTSENTQELSNTASSNASVESAGTDSEAASAKAAGILELRNKLQARINQLREKRKAPGTSAPGAPKSREELLAVRKQKLEQKKSQKRKRGEEPEAAETQGNDLEEEEHEEGEPEDIIFGGVSFKDGQKVGKNLELSVDKKIKKRTIQDQLKVLEQRKSKISELDEDKRADVEEKAKWSRMILQSEGAKLKDNEKLLKKALKQKKNKKLKSELEWNERKKKVADDIAQREAKRNRNIANHTVIKHTKGKNQKKKLRQRAGFEGKKRRKN